MSLLPNFDKALVKKARVTGKIKEKLAEVRQRTKIKETWKDNPRGCEHCPLSKDDELCKIKGLNRISGEKIFIWGMSPFKQENSYIGPDGKRGMELVGPSGKLLWKELGAVGISREDCDIQNVVRCMTATVEDDGNIVPRTPTKEEVYYCSKYTDRALELSKAKVHVILGNFAAKTLLGKEFKSTRTVFWSDRLKAKVICLYHPSYFLRAGYARSKIEAFREGIRTVKQIVSGTGSRYEVLEQLDLKGLSKPSEVREFCRKVKQVCIDHKWRLTIDIEEGRVYDKPRVLCIGMCYKSEMARTVYVDHPEDRRSKSDRSEIKEALASVLDDDRIKKGAHNGVYDILRVEELWGIKTKGYDYDTMLAEYLAYSEQKSYALGEIAQIRFPAFAGYKEIITPYLKPDYAGKSNYADIPKKIMTLYNGADCIVSKMIELTTRKLINLSLLKVYVLSSLTLHDMERRGPALDRKHFEVVVNTIPQQEAYLEEKLQRMVGDPGFNPRSAPQVKYVLYTQFKMPARKIDNRTGQKLYTTDKTALELLAPDYKFARILIDYRTLYRMKTYMTTYLRSAEAHGGELRTKWWLTGASTGRLSSGGGEDTVNFQNLHGNPLLKNLLVSDQRWRQLRKVYEGLQGV